MTRLSGGRARARAVSEFFDEAVLRGGFVRLLGFLRVLSLRPPSRTRRRKRRRRSTGGEDAKKAEKANEAAAEHSLIEKLRHSASSCAPSAPLRPVFQIFDSCSRKHTFTSLRHSALLRAHRTQFKTSDTHTFYLFP